MISELHKTKCIPDALDAFALLSKKHPEALLEIMGEGDERHAIETRMRELDIRDRVHLAGFEPDAASLLGACDLFLHTARSEALGYAILEAGCASLPVVATRVGGIPEIIIDDEHGRLVPQGDARALARAMSELIVHPRRAAEIGARLRARVATAFSKEKMLSATLARY